MPQLKHPVIIQSKEWLTHDVVQMKLEKPSGFEFTEGQAIELTINDPKFQNDAAPFTIANLNKDPEIEIIFKVYPGHQGMTLALSKLDAGEKLFISDPWDSFTYKGPGTFIAGGTGITAFIPIFRALKERNELSGHQLIFANKKHRDIFLSEELGDLFGKQYSNILSKARSLDHSFGRINKHFLKAKIKDFNQYFYVCGPGTFPDDVKALLLDLGANESSIIVAY